MLIAWNRLNYLFCWHYILIIQKQYTKCPPYWIVHLNFHKYPRNTVCYSAWCPDCCYDISTPCLTLWMLSKLNQILLFSSLTLIPLAPQKTPRYLKWSITLIRPSLPSGTMGLERLPRPNDMISVFLLLILRQSFPAISRMASVVFAISTSVSS